MAYDTILYEVRERICTITLNRPEHMNSYNSQMCQEINLALDAADSDDDVRVVIFTGAEGGKRPAAPAPAQATLEDIERQAIAAALVRFGGNISQTAFALGVSRPTLYRKMSKYGLEE